MGIRLGAVATAGKSVDKNNTAKAVGSGDLNVFGTPMMIALMEEAACNCLAVFLDEDQSSVGTRINVSHTAASPMGAKITATASIENVSGRRVEFRVAARDGNNPIGDGTHTRVIVDRDKFLARLAKS